MYANNAYVWCFWKYSSAISDLFLYFCFGESGFCTFRIEAAVKLNVNTILLAENQFSEGEKDMGHGTAWLYGIQLWMSNDS